MSPQTQEEIAKQLPSLNELEALVCIDPTSGFKKYWDAHYSKFPFQCLGKMANLGAIERYNSWIPRYQCGLRQIERKFGLQRVNDVIIQHLDLHLPRGEASIPRTFEKHIELCVEGCKTLEYSPPAPENHYKWVAKLEKIYKSIELAIQLVHDSYDTNQIPAQGPTPPANNVAVKRLAQASLPSTEIEQTTNSARPQARQARQTRGGRQARSPSLPADIEESVSSGTEETIEAVPRPRNGLAITPTQPAFSRTDNEKTRGLARLPARQTRQSRHAQRARSSSPASYNEDYISPLRKTWLENWRRRWERLGLEPPEPSPLPTHNRDLGTTRWWSGGQKDYCIYVYPEKPPPRPRHGMTEKQWWFYCKDHYDQADAAREPGEGCHWEISCLGGEWTRQLIRYSVETELEIHRQRFLRQM